MDPSPDQQQLIDRYINALGAVLIEAGTLVQTQAVPAVAYLDATDAYLGVSKEIGAMLAGIDDADVDSETSARWRLAWAAAGDDLVLKMTGAMSLAAQLDETDQSRRLAIDLLDQLAEDGFMPEQAIEGLRDNPRGSLAVVVTSAEGDQASIRSGVSGTKSVGGGQWIQRDSETVAREVVDRILGEATTALGKICAGTLASGIIAEVDVARLTSAALKHISGELARYPIPSKRLQRQAVSALNALSSKVQTLVGANSIRTACSVLLTHWKPGQAIVRHGVDLCLRTNDLEFLLVIYASLVPDLQHRKTMEALDGVRLHYLKWNRPANWTSTGLRWAGHLIKVVPGGLVYLIAGTLVLSSYVLFMAWDHLDWPRADIRGLANGVIGVLTDAPAEYRKRVEAERTLFVAALEQWNKRIPDEQLHLSEDRFYALVASELRVDPETDAPHLIDEMRKRLQAYEEDSPGAITDRFFGELMTHAQAKRGHEKIRQKRAAQVDVVIPKGPSVQSEGNEAKEP